MSPDPIHRILVAIKDPTTAASPSIMKAAQLAGAWDAELVLFHAIDMPLCPEAYNSENRDLGDDEESIRTHVLHNLNAQAAQVQDRGLAISVAAEWDYPAHEAVLRHAQHIGADLIVTERHTHGTRTSWGLHSTDWELLRLSPKPVLLVKNARGYERPVVLAAVDPLHQHAKPADLDTEIGTLAAALSATLQGTCHIVYAMPGTAGLKFEQIAGATVATPVVDPERAEAQAALDQLLQSLPFAPKGVKVQVGSPTEAILETSRTLHASILVMGAVSRSGLKRLMVGNTAEQVIDQVACDLLVVKPKSFGLHFSPRVRGAQMLPPTIAVPPLR
jgi:universal stress protein E